MKKFAKKIFKKKGKKSDKAEAAHRFSIPIPPAPIYAYSYDDRPQAASFDQYDQRTVLRNDATQSPSTPQFQPLPPTTTPHVPKIIEVPQTPLISAPHHPPKRRQPPPIRPGPANDLPGEILFSIFSACAPSKDLTHNEIIAGRYSPWPLSYVSSTWRSFCLATPELWTTIIYDAGNLTNLGATKNRARLILERSRDLPLTLKLHCSRDGNSGLPNPHPVIEVLAEAIGRWERLDLMMTMSMLNDLRSFKGRLGNLRHLSVKVLPFSQTSAFTSTTFEELPSLDTLDLKDGDMVLTPAMPIPFPVSNISTFVGRWSPRTLSSLSQCVGVTNCTLDYFSNFNKAPGTPLTTSPAFLPALQKVTVCADYEWVHTLFPVHTTQSVDLTVVLKYSVHVGRDLAQCLSRSALRVHALTLRIVKPVYRATSNESWMLMQVMHATPGVKRLELHTNKGIMFRLLEALIPSPGSLSGENDSFDILALDELVLRGVYDPMQCISLLVERFCTKGGIRRKKKTEDGEEEQRSENHGLSIRLVLNGSKYYRVLTSQGANMELLSLNGVAVILDAQPD